ncbi:MAG: Acetyltransferase (isoleucine patch superfamily)-like protein [Gammaproteobacteria bacterium]|nr:Acetyltransferase (isoleucine patch superfamily)-like protein [Gammaproteobacteria bacterium]
MKEPVRHYNLAEIYAHESMLQRYTRLTVGEGAGLWALIWHELLLGLCTGMPGLPGLGLRHALYPKIFKHFHRNTYIGRHVTLRCPRQITLEEDVIIDEFAQLIASTKQSQGITIGARSFVRSFAMINAGPPNGYVHIGRDSGIGQGAILYGNGGLSIGNNVMIAGQCFVVASSHNFDNPTRSISEQGYSAKGITIEDNVWIGAGVKILDGVTIGNGAIVGANAVVTHSIQPNIKVAGVPAREIKTRHEQGE